MNPKTITLAELLEGDGGLELWLELDDATRSYVLALTLHRLTRALQSDELLEAVEE